MRTISNIYDRAGKLTRKADNTGVTMSGWQDNDRMVSVRSPSTSAAYDYDANGQRVWQSDMNGVTNYLIDGQLPYAQVIAETDANGSLKVGYVFGLDRISQTRGNATHWYKVDGQGSVRQLSGQNGQTTDTYTYTAFGEELAKTGTTENEYKFVGEQLDPNSGFYYNRARWMNPSTGTFTSVDPYEGDPQSAATLHRYLYANESPVTFIDPTGKESMMELMAAMVLSDILCAYAQPVVGLKKTYSLIIYMIDYSDVGPDGKKGTADDVGITSFPGLYYADLLANIQSAFDGENAKGKAKFNYVWSAGMKAEVFTAAQTSRNSAILAHSSASFDALFPSLQELKDNGLSAEHITDAELQDIGHKGFSKGIYLAACNAGWWANGQLSSESKSSTEISAQLMAALKYLKEASLTQ
jgi:RHS repeat-associated protein